MLYKDVLNNWLIERKIFLKYSTYTNYYNIIHNHIMPYLGDYNIRGLNNNILQQFILQQLKNGRADNQGGNGRHNNVQHYITVFFWRRTT